MSDGLTPASGERRCYIDPPCVLCQGEQVAEQHDYDALWREAAPTLWRAVRAYAGGRQDVADEAVAEAFARVIAQESDIRDPVAYLYRVAFRIAARELKRSNMTQPLISAGELSDDPVATEVWVSLTNLTPDQRAVVYLFYRADLSVADIAERLGMSGPAVRMHLMRARRRLAPNLRETADD